MGAARRCGTRRIARRCLARRRRSWRSAGCTRHHGPSCGRPRARRSSFASRSIPWISCSSPTNIVSIVLTGTSSVSLAPILGPDVREVNAPPQGRPPAAPAVGRWTDDGGIHRAVQLCHGHVVRSLTFCSARRDDARETVTHGVENRRSELRGFGVVWRCRCLNHVLVMAPRAIQRRDDDASLWPTRTPSSSGALDRVCCRW